MRFNPIRPVKGLVKLIKVGNKVEDVMDEVKVYKKDPKSLLKSKTFWFNLLTLALLVSDYLPLKPEQALILVAVLNIALRLVTDGPVKAAENLSDALSKLPKPIPPPEDPKPPVETPDKE